MVELVELLQLLRVLHLLQKKIAYAIQWECPTILKNLLDESVTEKQEFLTKEDENEVLQSVLVDAIAQNNVSAVKALLQVSIYFTCQLAYLSIILWQL